MSLVKWGFIGLLALPAAEITVFIVVALTIGWLRALALFLATSLIGMIVLKQAGRTARERLRSELTRDGINAVHLESPGLATLIGGFLLVLPGFITDVAGALWFVPSIRRWAGAAVGRQFGQGAQAQRGPAVIDLPPDQWRPIDEGRIEDSSATDNPDRQRRP
jgi:UPF0716 protein FxsA